MTHLPTRIAGHAVTRTGLHDWRCTCGLPLGPTRDAARHAMVFHRLSVWDAARPLPAAEYGRGVDTVPDPAGLLSEATP